MTTVIYRLTRLEGSQRGGMNAAIDAEVRGIAKTNNAGPYTIANEIVATRLGQLLGLPIPAGVVAEGSGTLYYLSLDVGKEQKPLPPVIAADFASQEARLAAGCVVFDVWIANPDRHTSNLARDPAFQPPRVSLYDHGHALLGTGDPIGQARLDTCRDNLGLPQHALIAELAEYHLVRDWIDRVAAVPDYMVTDACTAVTIPGLNVDAELARALANWLLSRRDAIHEIISTNRNHFTKITQWELEEGAAS